MPYAVIVAHGQPSNPVPAEAALATFARQIGALCQRVTVRSATLSAPQALEDCLDSLPNDAVIYPLFMARGWFVTSALPKRIGSRPIKVLDPMGIDPELPALVTAALHQELADRNWRAAETDLVIAAHGSGRSPNPSAVASVFADTLSQLTPFKSIRTGFVEQSPSIAEAAINCRGNALCLPFFACTGGHVLEDVPQELARARFPGHVMPVISELPQVRRHIAAKLDSL